MILTPEQKTALFQLFEDQGLRGKRRNRYVFEDGTRTGRLKDVLVKLGFPATLEAANLVTVAYSYVTNKSLFMTNIEPLLTEYSAGCDLSPFADMGEEEEYEAVESRDTIRNLTPVISLSPQGDEVILINEEVGRIAHDVNYKIYMTLMGTTLEEMILERRIKLVKPVFNPYVTKIIFSGVLEDGSKANYLNLYSPPPWRKIGATPNYTGFIKTLIEHLFPIEEDREYVLDWLHYMLTSRNSTVLCLVGARGTGKGILIKDIAGALIGQSHTEIVGQAILEEKFNAPFKNKRLIFFDEVDISGDKQIRRFKAYCNDRIALEAKGEDSVTIDNFSSMALSSNDRKEFRVEPQERRFSVPRITEVPLLSKMPEAEISTFSALCKDPDSIVIAEFGEYLLQRKPKYSSQTPYRTDYFFELCRISMPVWRLFIIDRLSRCTEIEDITLKEMQSAFREEYREGKGGPKFPSSKTTIQEFLFQYRHMGGITIGELLELRDDEISTWVIRPTAEMVRHNNVRLNLVKEEVENDEDDMMGL